MLNFEAGTLVQYVYRHGAYELGTLGIVLNRALAKFDPESVSVVMIDGDMVGQRGVWNVVNVKRIDDAEG